MDFFWKPSDAFQEDPLRQGARFRNNFDGFRAFAPWSSVEPRLQQPDQLRRLSFTGVNAAEAQSRGLGHCLAVLGSAISGITLEHS